MTKGKDNRILNVSLGDNDGLLVTWFLGTISESVLSMIENAETAHQVWSSLEE